MDQFQPHDDAAASDNIKLKMLYGVVYRASNTLYAWSIFASLYGFFSLKLIQHYRPDVTLFDNLWPRIFFNSVPIFLLARWFSKYKVHTKLKAYVSCAALPLLLLIGSAIYAWPIFWSGQHDFYLYFHATNIIAMASCISLIAGTPRIVLFQCLGFGAIYFGPLLFLFRADKLLLELIVSDVALISFLLFIGLQSTYKLRLKLAMEDVMRKRKVTPFLGNNLATAIYDTGEMEMKGYSQRGIIMAVDLRGYTGFMQSAAPAVAKAFMAGYHSMVTRVMTQNGGYLHKTNGDGLLASFGVMEKEEDLSDIPNLDSEIEDAESRKRRNLIVRAEKVFEKMLSEFELLKKNCNIDSRLLVGAGVAFGDIEVVVRGDANFRQELDIDGETIVRAVRLESYSKLLNKMVDVDSSFLVISPELFEASDSIIGSKIWLTNTDTLAIRDYPEIKSVKYRQWKHNRVRVNQNAA